MNPVAFSVCLVALLSTSALAASDLVSYFSKAFARTLENDNYGRKILDLTKDPPAESGKAFQGVMLDLFKRDGDPIGGGDTLAHNLDETVRQDIDDVSPSEFASALGELYADTLDKRNLLTDDNASELGSKLGKDIIANARKSGLPTLKAKWQALVDPPAKFYSTFGLEEKNYAKEMSKDLARLLGCHDKSV